MPAEQKVLADAVYRREPHAVFGRVAAKSTQRERPNSLFNPVSLLRRPN